MAFKIEGATLLKVYWMFKGLQMNGVEARGLGIATAAANAGAAATTTEDAGAAVTAAEDAGAAVTATAPTQARVVVSEAATSRRLRDDLDSFMWCPLLEVPPLFAVAVFLTDGRFNRPHANAVECSGGVRAAPESCEQPSAAHRFGARHSAWPERASGLKREHEIVGSVRDHRGGDRGRIEEAAPGAREDVGRGVLFTVNFRAAL